ncbi:hypothetical protein BKA64DRAFT_713746 [Cadophora sp. MPI-SDFR-AT-0126]|nr:hypothetical protein BKA64DRAFT_713746 [Leotiomycetes sp. MPI-SDFR-AT-0126]
MSPRPNLKSGFLKHLLAETPGEQLTAPMGHREIRRPCSSRVSPFGIVKLELAIRCPLSLSKPASFATFATLSSTTLTGTNPTMTSSSTKAHSGSHKGSTSHKSSSSQKHSESSPKNKSSGEIVERFVQEDRDHRSFAIEEYDAHQEAARQSHAEKLRDAVEKDY